MNGRRQFLKGASLLSAIFASGAVARTQAANALLDSPAVVDGNSAAVSEAIDPNVVALIEEQSTSSLALTQTYGEIAPPPPPQEVCRIGSDGAFMIGSSYTTAPLYVSSAGGVCINGERKSYVPGTEKQVNVKMVPGPDGELYLNVNGNWKKVLTV